LEPAQNAPILGELCFLRGLDAEDLVGGHAEDAGQVDEQFAVQAQLTALVVGDDGLRNAKEIGHLALRDSVLLAETREALADSFDPVLGSSPSANYGQASA
jgi:hypothetical protein